MTENSRPILEVQNLSNLYEGQPLLQDVGFSLEKGEILCLLGPSGSGKTTLLRLIAGLEQEDSGTICFQGLDMKSVPSHKRNFGMMFQEYALFPHKNVQQNVSFGLEMQKCPAAEQESRVRETLKLVGLSGFEYRQVDELSGGERQRVALARSLAPEPQLLLLDEPLGSLDRTLRDRLILEIRQILKSLGVTAIFVTHDQTEAFSVADKVAVLHNGSLQQLDTPDRLYRFPKNSAVASFLGFNNLIKGYMATGSLFHGPLGPVQLPDSVQPGSDRPIAGCRHEDEAILLIRPEGAAVAAPKQSGSASSLVSGVVSSRQFQGSRYKVKIRVDETSLTFDLPIDPEPPETGQPISLYLSPSALVLLRE